MRRVIPQEVVAAYKATGLKPARCTFFEIDNETESVIEACPLTVLACSMGLKVETSSMPDVFLAKHGYTHVYMANFMATIDGGFGFDPECSSDADVDARDTIRALREAGLVDWAVFAPPKDESDDE